MTQVRLGIALLCIVSGGCSMRPQFALRYSTPPPSGSLVGNIAVQVIDARQPGRGGTDPSKIGQETNPRGAIVSNIYAFPGQEPMNVLNNLVPAALAHAGYQVVGPGPGVPTMTVSVSDFWLSGLGNYSMTMTAALSLTPGGGVESLWSDTLTAQGASATIGMDFRTAIEGGFQSMLDAAIVNLAQKVASSNFHAAYARATGAPGPTPAAPGLTPTDSTSAPPPPPSSPPGVGLVGACRLNSDCPVGQHCADGSCLVQCREDRDCVTGQTCNTSNGQCE